jgi:hypothetical protein
MNTTTYSNIDLVYGLLDDSKKRSINNARALGHMQGTALGVIYQLESIMLYGKMNDSDKSFVKEAVDRLRKAVDATEDPHAFGKGMD